MKRLAEVERKTKETQIQASLVLDGQGKNQINTGIGFFNHMLTLFSVHGLFDLSLTAVGDIEVDYHHTVEDVGLVMGEMINKALGDRKGIQRYGYAVIPMDEALAHVAIDLSNRPFTVFEFPEPPICHNEFDVSLFKEFFRSMAQRAGMNLHIRLSNGDNWHHMVEAAFKAVGRALRQAVARDSRITGVPSSKGVL
jgi:imidazoleglycerol-phosphate dehydratase